MPDRPLGAVSARLAQPLVREWIARGQDPAELAERVGVSLEHLGRIDGRIAYEAWSDIRAFGIARTRDPSFPLAAVRHLDRASVPLELYLVGTQPTFKEGTRFAMPYGSSLVDGLDVRLTLGERGGLATFLRHGEPFGPPELAEYFLACLWTFTRLVAPQSPPPRSVLFVHRWPRHDLDLEAHFSAPVRFGAAEVGFRFDLPNVEAPLASADPGLGRLLANTAAARIADGGLSVTLRDRARHWLRGELRGEGAIGKRLATAMHLSERSLRRQLAEQGTSLRDLLDEVRKERALELLETSDESLDAIAVELGYANASAFGRAFRRWTEQTPSEYVKARSRAGD